jgi:BirA family biotin operon repressor/biotin-[acetyl-CoA-carboxylase] ligase
MQRVWIELDEVTSTMDVIRDYVRDGYPLGTVVLAGVQTGGRGRRGAVWANAGTACLMSFLLPVTPGLPLEIIPLLGGVAAFDAAAAVCGDDGLAIKFPNDVLLRGDKVAGVLVEQWDVFGTAVYVVGIGINVAEPPALTDGCTTGALVASGTDVLPRKIAGHVISAVDTFLESANITAALVDAWNGRHAGGYWRHHPSLGKVSIVRLSGVGHVVVMLPDGTERSVSASSLMLDSAVR